MVHDILDNGRKGFGSLVPLDGATHDGHGSTHEIAEAFLVELRRLVNGVGDLVVAAGGRSVFYHGVEVLALERAHGAKPAPGATLGGHDPMATETRTRLDRGRQTRGRSRTAAAAAAVRIFGVGSGAHRLGWEGFEKRERERHTHTRSSCTHTLYSHTSRKGRLGRPGGATRLLLLLAPEEGGAVRCASDNRGGRSVSPMSAVGTDDDASSKS